MSALRDRDVLDGPAGHDTGRSTLRELAYRALAAPAGPPLLASGFRARPFRQAVVVGASGRAAGGDVVELAAEFQALRAEIRGRRRRQLHHLAGVGSPPRDGRVDALLDEVLVAIVRGYEENLELETSSARSTSDAVERRATSSSSDRP